LLNTFEQGRWVDLLLIQVDKIILSLNYRKWIPVIDLIIK